MNKQDLIKITSKINKESCPKYINFHCHTTFSDGSMTPLQLLKEAYKNKTKYIAITDHHSINAHKDIYKKKLMKKFPLKSIIVVTGIEINCLLKGCLVHVLGLGIDIESEFLAPYTKGESPVGNDLHIKAVSQAIRKSGGISFLAHPGRYRIPFNILIPEAYKNNIDGIEVWYDYTLNEYWNPSPFICEEIEKLTNKYGMLKSCGTDSHGYSLMGR
tara:strand:+ start:2461 stop:3108 length:648 start_codon:yes stop_codon:yes gene_type:complete